MLSPYNVVARLFVLLDQPGRPATVEPLLRRLLSRDDPRDRWPNPWFAPGLSRLAELREQHGEGVLAVVEGDLEAALGERASDAIAARVASFQAWFQLRMDRVEAVDAIVVGRVRSGFKVRAGKLDVYLTPADVDGVELVVGERRAFRVTSTRPTLSPQNVSGDVVCVPFSAAPRRYPEPLSPTLTATLLELDDRRLHKRVLQSQIVRVADDFWDHWQRVAPRKAVAWALRTPWSELGSRARRARLIARDVDDDGDIDADIALGLRRDQLDFVRHAALGALARRPQLAARFVDVLQSISTISTGCCEHGCCEPERDLAASALATLVATHAASADAAWVKLLALAALPTAFPPLMAHRARRLAAARVDDAAAVDVAALPPVAQAAWRVARGRKNDLDEALAGVLAGTLSEAVFPRAE